MVRVSSRISRDQLTKIDPCQYRVGPESIGTYDISKSQTVEFLITSTACGMKGQENRPKQGDSHQAYYTQHAEKAQKEIAVKRRVIQYEDRRYAIEVLDPVEPSRWKRGTSFAFDKSVVGGDIGPGTY